MADKIIQPIIGEVQRFPDQEDTIIEKELPGGKTIREFWIKSPVTQKIAKIAVWDNIAPELTLEPGDWVGLSVSIQTNGEFVNLTARTIAKFAAEENVDDRETKPAVKRKAKPRTDEADVSF